MDENRTGRSRRPRAALAPRLEALEGRRLMAAPAVPAAIGIKEVAQAGGVVDLVVTGTNQADTIDIEDDGSGRAGNVTVSLGDGTTYVAKSPISVVEVHANGGDDQVAYNLTGNLVAPRTVKVNLGAGNDGFTSVLSGAIANPIGLDLEAYGGAGNDNLSVDQRGPVLAGLVMPYLDGGAGNDALSYVGTGDVAAGASLVPGLSGGAGNDTINSRYDGVDKGNYIYNLSVDGGAGNDVINDTVHLRAGSTGTVGTDASTPAAVVGGAGNDQVFFSVTADNPAEAAGVNAVAVGGPGKDQVKRTARVLGDATNEKDAVVT